MINNLKLYKILIFLSRNINFYVTSCFPISNLINRIFNSTSIMSPLALHIEDLENQSESNPPSTPIVVDIYDTPIDYNFSYINCEHFKRCIIFGYNTMNRINKWNELRNFVVDESGGFQCGYKNDTIIYIMDEINNDYQGHSGASMGITMRQLHFISQYGLQAYKDKYTI